MLERCVVLGSVLLSALVAGDIVATTSGPTSSMLLKGKFEVPGGPTSNQAWYDLVGARFVELPAHLDGVYSFVPGHRLKKAVVHMKCKQNAGGTVKHCDMFAFLFRCPPCEAEHGGLVQWLLSDGWSLSGCSMKFLTGVAGGAPHKMVTLRKQVPLHGEVAFVTPNIPIDFVAFGGSDYGVACGGFGGYEPCVGAVAGNGATGMCAWDHTEGACYHTNFCPPFLGPHQGQGMGCQICPDDELPEGHPVNFV